MFTYHMTGAFRAFCKSYSNFKHTTEAIYSYDRQFIDEETNEIITFNVLCDEYRIERIHIHHFPLTGAQSILPITL